MLRLEGGGWVFRALSAAASCGPCGGQDGVAVVQQAGFQFGIAVLQVGKLGQTGSGLCFCGLQPGLGGFELLIGLSGGFFPLFLAGGQCLSGGFGFLAARSTSFSRRCSFWVARSCSCWRSWAWAATVSSRRC